VGQYFDEETGLHYNYHRYYDPSTGRYLRPDPIGQLGGINVYLYTENNPINAIDPLGLKLTIRGTAKEKALINAWLNQIEKAARNCNSEDARDILRRLSLVRDPNGMEFFIMFSDIGYRAGQYKTQSASFINNGAPFGVVELDNILKDSNQTTSWYNTPYGSEIDEGHYRGTDVIAHELLGHGYDAATGDYRNNQRSAIETANKVRALTGQVQRRRE